MTANNSHLHVLCHAMVVMKLIAMTTNREGCGLIVAQRIKFEFCRREDSMSCHVCCIQGKVVYLTLVGGQSLAVGGGRL